MSAKIRCPECGYVQEIEVPESARLLFYRCEGCGRLIQAPADSCWVICAYSDRRCPVSDSG